MGYALLVPGLVLAALLVAPPFLSGFLLTLLTQALIYAILAMSLDIVLGYTGLASLGTPPISALALTPSPSSPRVTAQASG